MEFIEALVVVVQLALAGFVMWGGWLCFSPGLLGNLKIDSFERAASLVLLALLFTTIALVV